MCKKAQNCTFQVGDIVYLHSPVLGQDQSKKLARTWHGPYYVVQKLSNVHVRLRSVHNNQIHPHKVHINRLKPADSRRAFSESDSSAKQVSSVSENLLENPQPPTCTADKETALPIVTADKGTALPTVPADTETALPI